MNRRHLLLCTGSMLILCMMGLPFHFCLHAAGSLPARLSDQEFWKMVQEFSEPDGTFQSDNLLSNEIQLQYVIPDLLKTVKPGGVYMGVGPEQNFTYISSLKPSMAFIVDIRRGNLDLHLFYKALFELSADRAEFVSRLFAREKQKVLTEKSTAKEIFDAYSRLPKSDKVYAETLKGIRSQLLGKHEFGLSQDDLSGIEHVYQAFAQFGPDLQYSSTGRGALGGGYNLGPGVGFGGYGPMITYAELMTATDADGQPRSYLASEEDFKFLKNLETKNLLVPVIGDFAGPKAIRSVGRYVREKGATISTFYLSNVEMYLMRSGNWGSFCSNVATLPLVETSTFIRSSRSSQYGRRGGLNSELGKMQSETKICR